jgi:SAM-dependent methyltransferase
MGAPNPDLVWELMTAHQRTSALRAGVELGVFDALGEGPAAASELAARAGVAEWVTFARTMQPILRNAAEFLAEVVVRDGAPAKVLDVAASHGLFGFAVARRAPGCEIVALDFPSVLEVTKEHAAAEGIAISAIAGSAFTADLGTGYDAVLVTNLYHHFSVEDCVALMKRFREALKPGGRMLTLEFVPDEERLTPPAPAQFALMMLTNTPLGDAYTFGDYNRMLDAAGFGAREMMDVPQSAQRLIVAARG